MIKAISAATTDDLMRRAIRHVLKMGKPTEPTRGQALEVCGVGLELTNPRARLSRSEGRGRVWSCLGELLWYLSGSNALEHIAYYVPAYEKEAENGLIHGGYGPRLLNWGGVNQIENVISTLRQKPSSRRAVIQIFDHEDLSEVHKEIPCTCTLQFIVREGSLHLIAYMRSNDIYLGLPHDIFAFTMLQELVARSLGVGLGRYTHFVGSLHLYEKNKLKAKAFLREGWFSTADLMPEMPRGDQWSNVRLMTEAESAIRRGVEYNFDRLNSAPYWADIVRLLQAFAAHKKNDIAAIENILDSMSTSAYNLYIQSRLDKR
jgi:thymidylate synthase